MSRATFSKTIAAPLELVFDTIADVEKFARAIPHSVGVEFLSERRRGVGTRFRETRETTGRRTTTDLEITECVANERVRLVADSHGTIWDTLFEVRQVAGGTELDVTLEAKAHQVMAGLMNAVMMPVLRGYIEDDLEAVKEHCEAQAGG